MNHVDKSQLRKCIIKPYEEFQDDVTNAFPERLYISFEMSLDGLSIADYDDDDDFCLESTYDRLAKYYGVKEITSIHADDEDNPIGIWIAYKE